MTRAKEELILTCSGEESRFLAHLSGNALSGKKKNRGKKRRVVIRCASLNWEIENGRMSG